MEGEFEENPTVEFARRLGQKVAKENVSTIVAIGGGSTIDTAKAAAWFAVNPTWTNGADPSEASVPMTTIVAIPTTAGTGSEVTPYAILTNNETHRKEILQHKKLVPKVAVCDPRLTVSMPAHVTAHTGVDALSHSIEAYFSKRCEGLLADFPLIACRRIAEHLPTAIARPDDLTARTEVMLAALEGGIVLAHCGTVIVHALGYNLTRVLGYSHGLSNSLLLAGFVEHLAQRGNQRAQNVLGCFDGDLQGFIRRCGITESLADQDISAQTRDDWLRSAYESYGRPNCVLPLEYADVADILDRAMVSQRKAS